MSTLCTETKKGTLLFKRLSEVIPGGVSSPARAFLGMDVDPLVVSQGKGDRFIDVNGDSYIDLCCSWGALLHGHAHPEIIESAIKTMEKGSTFGISTELEELLARKIIKHLPSIEKIRFVSSGTEATMYAVRLARGVTGRSRIVKFIGNYHGNADQFLVKAGSGLSRLNVTSTSRGVPSEIIENTICLPYNDLTSLEALFNSEIASSIAAVIIEPVAGNMGVVPATSNFLHKLREITTNSGSLLIFDEVISGFRVGLEGAQGLYGIDPDITTLGKIIGGGFPAAAFGGKALYMDHLAPLGEVYQAGTLSGNPVAMAAGLKTLELAEKPGFYHTLFANTKKITDAIKQILQLHEGKASVQQVGAMYTLFFGIDAMNSMSDGDKLNLPEFTRFFRYLLKKGVYIPPSQFEASFISSVHSQETIEYVIMVIESYFKEL